RAQGLTANSPSSTASENTADMTVLPYKDSASVGDTARHGPVVAGDAGDGAIDARRSRLVLWTDHAVRGRVGRAGQPCKKRTWRTWGPALNRRKSRNPSVRRGRLISPPAHLVSTALLTYWYVTGRLGTRDLEAYTCALPARASDAP